MASTIHDMVTSIMALRSELPSAPDELKRRIQSIRVRSTHELQGVSHGWRRAVPTNQHVQQSPSSRFTNINKTPYTNNGNWRQAVNNNSPISQQSQNSPSANNQTSESPFRFSSSSPASINKTIHRVASSFSATQEQNTSPTPGTPTPPPVQMRYISKFHNGSKMGDDQILNTVILNKLNTFSVKTYDDVKQFLFQILGSDQREFVREFTRLVFRKAAAEDKFCPLFAKLLSEIKREYPVIMEEMQKLHTTYLDIWTIKDSSDTKVDKRYRLGYSQFLAELTALGVLDIDTMKATINMLKACILECIIAEEYRETIEEYTDCLKQLCGTKVPKAVREMLRELLVGDLETWITKSPKEFPGLSNKSRFACMDLRDLLLK
jgi:hypothetical protein